MIAAELLLTDTLVKACIGYAVGNLLGKAAVFWLMRRKGS